MDILFILFSVPLLIFAASSFYIASYYRARRKGYRPPTAMLVLISGAAAGALSVFAITPRVMLSSNNLVMEFSTYFWLPVVVSMIVTACIILALPRRNPRVAGPRRPRFPFFAAGILVVGAGVVFLLFAFVKGGADLIVGAVRILIFLSAFAAPLFFMGKRGAVSLDDVGRSDPRSPVLYLRPFIQEADVFVAGPNSRFGAYTSRWQSSASGAGELSLGGENMLNADPQVTVRFERYFSDAITRRIGPLVALGNPEDYTQPEGAVRLYGSDADWKDHVKRLAGSSSCIVTEVAGSHNLKWELDYLRQQELQQKLFVFTKPSKKNPYKLYPFFVWLKGGMAQVKWTDYARSMASSGYELGDDPGPGTVLTFDANGKAITLTTRAQSPEDFVEPIRSLLELRDGYSSAVLDLPVAEPASASPAGSRA
jgi:hypothetical protein